MTGDSKPIPEFPDFVPVTSEEIGGLPEGAGLEVFDHRIVERCGRIAPDQVLHARGAEQTSPLVSA